MVVAGATVPDARSRLNANQIRGFWAAWGGWALDGMDASIYAVVLVPALTELLPRSDRSDADCAARRICRRRCGAARIVRHGTPVGRHHPRVRGAADHRRTIRAPGDDGPLLHLDGRQRRRRVRVRLL